FEPVFAEAKRIIAAGTIGEPRTVVLTYNQSLPPPARRWYVDSGILNEMHVHGLDLALWWFDREPREVRAELHNRLGFLGEDDAWTEIGFGDGARAVVHGAYRPDFPAVSGRHDIAFQV